MNRLIKNIFLIILTSVSVLVAEDPGLRAYHENDFEKSLSFYLKKLENDPANPVLNYNAGTTAMKSGRPDLAVPHFEKSLRNAEDRKILSKNSYNLGHLFAENKDYEQALNAFMQAILLNPEDVNSKIMYEIIKSQMQEQEQDQEQNQESNQNREQDQDQEKNQDQDQRREQDQEQQSDSNPQENQRQEDTTPESREPEQDMTEQQIVNLLDAMRDKEKEAMKEILRYRYQDYKIQREKDW